MCDDDNDCNFISIGKNTCKLHQACDIETTDVIHTIYKKIKGNI